MVLVRFTATAERHVDEIHRWWVENRTASPGLFRAELSAQLNRLARAPAAGAIYAAYRGRFEVRRVILRRSGFHLYYTISTEASELVVRAVWHAMRGHGLHLR